MNTKYLGEIGLLIAIGCSIYLSNLPRETDEYKYKVIDMDNYPKGYTNKPPRGNCIETNKGLVCGSFIIKNNTRFKG